MSQITVGEDIFGVLMVVGLISTFIVALTQFYSAHMELSGLQKGSRLVLSISDQLRNEVLSRSEEGHRPGIIETTAFEEDLPNFTKFLEREGLELSVEFVTLNGETLLHHGNLANFSRSMSFPAVLREGPRKRTGRMIVWVRGR